MFLDDKLKIDKDVLTQEMKEEEEVLEELNKAKHFNIDSVIPNGRKLVIADCDECIVNITIKWFELGCDAGLFDPKISIEDIINRKKYYISDMMVPFDKVKGYLKDKSIKSIDELALRLYDIEGFYDDLLLTNLGGSLQKLLDAKLIDLVIISHTTPKNKESKEKLLKKEFPSARLFLEDHKVPKSYIINKYKLNEYTTFIDDDLRNIYDVIVNTNSVGKEFVIPKFGYNDVFYSKGMTEEEISKKQFTELDRDMLELIEKLGCQIVYVEPL